MIETVKRPYEFLVRWRDGVISGAHVGFELTATENGKVLSTTPLPVVAVGDGGFPLSDILGQIQIDALKDRDVAQAEAKEKSDECAAHEKTIADLQEQLKEANATATKKDKEISDLRAKLDEAKSAQAEPA